MVQPYEFSFNVSRDSTRNSRISGWDNLKELVKLEGATIEKVYYIMPDATYEYDIPGVYVKKQYKGTAITGKMDGNNVVLSVSTFGSLENPVITVTYTVGKGKQAKKTVVPEAAVKEGTSTYTVDLSGVELSDEGTFSAVISSDKIADIAVSLE